MEKQKKISLAVIFILAMGLQKTYSQIKWEVVVDTIKIGEVKVVDSTIITMLDSAFTFLRFPPLEFGPYYYSLSIKKASEPGVRPIFDIRLFVEDYLITDAPSLDVFNRYYNLLFNYKGVQILVRYNREDNDTSAFQFFHPTGNKGNFYHYHKVDKSRPKVLFIPDNYYDQSVRFLVRKGYMHFLGYKLDIRKSGW